MRVTDSVSSRYKQYGLTIFLVLTFAISWTSYLLDLPAAFFFNLTLGLALPFSENAFLFLGILLFLTVTLIVWLRPAAPTGKVSLNL